MFKTALIALLLGLGLAAPAAAHTEVVSTSPRDGQELSSAPTEVSVTLSEPPMSKGAQLVLQTNPGRPVVLDVAVKGSTLTAPVPTGMRGGTYLLLYRAVAEDGHPLQGSVRFDFAGDETTAASPTASPTATPTDTSKSGKFPWIPVGLVVGLGIGFVLSLRARRSAR